MGKSHLNLINWDTRVNGKMRERTLRYRLESEKQSPDYSPWNTLPSTPISRTFFSDSRAAFLSGKGPSLTL